jgi:[ribosomal protein S5]-alanine N-acetyltransferase
MTNRHESLPRIELMPLTISMMEGIIDDDRTKAAGGHDLVFLDPMLPFDIAEALPFILARIRDRPDTEPWWARLIVRRDDRAVIGSVGFAGPPDDDGKVTMGYSVDPAEEGKGYATEAARMQMAWGFAQPEVRAIRATISPSNGASLRIAAKCGMANVGMTYDDDEGDLEVWEISRDQFDDPI